MSQRITLQNGVVSFKRMEPFTPGQANLNPPKKIKRIRDLLSSNAPKICIVRGEGIGDVLMTTPAVAELQILFNNSADITYATNTKYLDGALASVLKYNPDINKVIDRDNVDESDYDVTVSLHCPAMAYEKRDNPPLNRIDIFARHMGLNHLRDPKPRYYVQKEDLEWGLNEYSKHILKPGTKTMLVNLFSSSDRRCIDSGKTKEAIIDLFQQHGIRSLIIRHNSDRSTSIDWGSIPGCSVLENPSVRQIAGIMPYCSIMLCPDSACLHLGGAIGMPTVSLFGHTDPRARVNYYPNSIAIWEGASINRCPCWWDTCPTGYTCWKMISKESIVNTVLSQLQKTKPIDIHSLLLNNKPHIKAEVI